MQDWGILMSDGFGASPTASATHYVRLEDVPMEESKGDFVVSHIVRLKVRLISLEHTRPLEHGLGTHS